MRRSLFLQSRKIARLFLVTILPILLYGDPRLAEPCEPVAEVTPAIQKLARDMAHTMYAAPGVGLAAPQVGVSIRLMVIDKTAGNEPDSLLTLINPEITYREGSVREEEGCLSFPDIVEVIDRPAVVSCRALGIDGKEFAVEKAVGLLARAICHELDHLDGVLLIDRVNAFRRSMLRKKIKKKVRAGEWVSDSVEEGAAVL